MEYVPSVVGAANTEPQHFPSARRLVFIYIPGQGQTALRFGAAWLHARAGSPAQISGYLGNSDTFDNAIGKFASAYADQSERDHAILVARSGRVAVVREED